MSTRYNLPDSIPQLPRYPAITASKLSSPLKPLPEHAPPIRPPREILTTPLPQPNSNITWHPSLSRKERESFRKQKGFTIWFTGLSASGKSTVATALEQHLLHLGLAAYRLDGDNVRFGLNKDLGFSDKDRVENIRRIGEVRFFVHFSSSPAFISILCRS